MGKLNIAAHARMWYIYVCVCHMFITWRVYGRFYGRDKGRLDHLLPKFEHIFVAAITFFPFLLCRGYRYSVVFGAVGNKVSHISSTLHRVVIIAWSRHRLGC